MTRPALVALAVVLLAVVLVIANPWRGERDRAASESDGGTADLEGAPSVVRAIAPEPRSFPPIGAPATTLPVETSRDSAPAEQDLKTLVEGIDPLLVESNVIVRAPEPNQTGPGFVELESRFGTEIADAAWSPGMQARILDEVAQVRGLKLVSLETECRATICRVKLFHPPGTNAMTSLANLVPMATRIGFAHVVHVATFGENRMPISVLYFQRSQTSADSVQ